MVKQVHKAKQKDSYQMYEKYVVSQKFNGIGYATKGQ